MLTITGLHAGYGKLRVLSGVSLEVPTGGITVVVGPNGAGKTTLLCSIMGIASVFSGDVIFEGDKLTGASPYEGTRKGMPYVPAPWPWRRRVSQPVEVARRGISYFPVPWPRGRAVSQPFEVARKGISYVPQMRNVFADLSVLDNLQIAGYMLPRDEVRAKADQMTEIFPVLKRFIHRKAGTLSGGERRMLAIAMGLMKKPKLMLLDELSTDLAPIMARRVLTEIVRLRDEMGITILLVEQMAKRALEIGDTAYLLVSGEVRFEGEALALLRDPELSRLYLGIKGA